MPQDIDRLLVSGAKELGLMLTDSQVGACLLYLAELEKWNRKINLTAIHDERDIIIKHFLDSFSFLRGFSSSPVPGVKLLDMGSGAGFPAIPLKIACPGLTVVMVEAVKKKASFLRHIIRTLRLSGIDVFDRRTDEVPASHHSAYDLVTARAFADMEKAIQAGICFLKPGGRMVLSRGPEESIEGQELEKAGMSLERRIALTLPFSDYQRTIWVFRRTRG